jgi:hypothetical protein
MLLTAQVFLTMALGLPFFITRSRIWRPSKEANGHSQI